MTARPVRATFMAFLAVRANRVALGAIVTARVVFSALMGVLPSPEIASKGRGFLDTVLASGALTERIALLAAVAFVAADYRFGSFDLTAQWMRHRPQLLLVKAACCAALVIAAEIVGVVIGTVICGLIVRARQLPFPLSAGTSTRVILAQIGASGYFAVIGVTVAWIVRRLLPAVVIAVLLPSVETALRFGSERLGLDIDRWSPFTGIARLETTGSSGPPPALIQAAIVALVFAAALCFVAASSSNRDIGAVGD